MDILKAFRWSFSQWENYNGCPARWNYKSRLKLPGKPPGPAAARGIQIHGTVEDYILGRTDSVHEAVSPKYMGIIQQYRDHATGDRHCEYRMSFDKDWSLSGGILSPVGWVQVVLDAVRADDQEVNIAEWKSGKPKDTHGDQRKLYALAGLCRWTYVERVKVTTYYLEDTAEPQRLVVNNTENAHKTLKTLWLQRADQMERDKICAPKPGFHCNWCDYSKKAGGPCAFGA